MRYIILLCIYPTLKSTKNNFNIIIDDYTADYKWVKLFIKKYVYILLYNLLPTSVKR
jgi:hypothetical protein